MTLGPVYLITDSQSHWSIEHQVVAGAKGGAQFIQLRDKQLSDAAFERLALSIQKRLKPFNCKLIINDRVDIAIKLAVDGLHVGQGDGDIKEVRARIGQNMLLGQSIETPQQLSKIPPGTLDYIGVGPIRATSTKPNHAPPLGFDGLRAVLELTDLPVYAIGGLNGSDISTLKRMGCSGIAVVSAVTRAENPESEVRSLSSLWEQHD